MMARNWLCAAAVATLAYAPVAAATITLPASRDATIFENNPDNASGAGNGLFAGTNGIGSPRRALVAFDLAAIPAGATIESVELRLYLGQVAGSGGGVPGGGVETAAIGLHRVLASWGEGATQRHAPPSDTFVAQAQGEPSEEGDVTWNNRFHAAVEATPWMTPGGEFAFADSSSLVVGRTLNVPYAWPSTPSLVGDVAAWLANPTANHGWMLVNLDESAITTFRAFYSREVATAAYHPTLTVAYSATTLAGADFEEDRDVDGADLLVWQRNVGTSGGATRRTGDATGEGTVTDLDLSAWKQQFGTAVPAQTPVPEPLAPTLAMGAACSAVATARRTSLLKMRGSSI